MSPDEYQPEWLNGIDEVVHDPIRFKIKLDIGEEAYTSLKLKTHFLDAVDAGNGAVAGVALAKSSVVAGTFFAPSGLLGAIGIGAAATPVGWAIAAGAIGAGLSVVVGKYFTRGGSSRVSTIPEFINTPLDILAVGLFDLIGMLSIKVAAIDGRVDTREYECISNYFVKEWGYNETFVSKALEEMKSQESQYTIKSIAQKLADFKLNNPDCNYDSMTKEIISFLNEVVESDDFIDEREEMALERVQKIFEDAGSFTTRVSKSASSGMESIKESSQKGFQSVSDGASSAAKSISKLGSSLMDKVKK
jgi:uncharacterized tellurite resistance protein B-like protein